MIAKKPGKSERPILLPVVTRWRGLVIQLLALIVLPMLLIAAAVAYEGVTYHEQAMHTLVQERDMRAVNAASETLSDRFMQRQIMLQILADQIGNGRSLINIMASDQQLQMIFDQGVIATDENGQIIDIWPSDVAWKSALRSSSVPWVLEHTTTHPVVIINTQNMDKHLTLFGGMSLNSLNVAGAVGVMRNNSQTQIYLIADDGHILDSSTDAAVGTNITDWPALADSNQNQDIRVTSRIASLNWTLTVQEPWDAIIGQGTHLSLITPLAILPVVFLAAIILAFCTIRIIIPLYRLKQQTDRLAWGDYMAIRQPVGGVQEIRDLQAGLSQMTQRLQQAQTGMHSYIGAMLRGQEDERLRIARELHDDILQMLIAINQKRQMVQHVLETDPAKAINHLNQIQEMTETAITGLRNLIRNVRPAYLEDLGLAPALEMLAQTIKSSSTIHFTHTGQERRLMPDHELAMYRIAQEAVTNAVRHANATEIHVQLVFDTQISLIIRDNGIGFVVPPRPDVFTQTEHYGLAGIVERAEQIGALCQIESRLGRGTTITIQLNQHLVKL